KFGFLRELISNSHDAYRRLISETSDPHAAVGKDIVIDIYKDGDNTNDGDVKESRENNGEDKGKDGNNEDGRRVFFSLEEKGIGMSIEELVNYVGKLGGSGTRDFNSDETIGQFGTGLYASLSVADELEILTKRYGSDKAYLLRLKRGSTAYTIDEIEKADVGTKVVLRIDDANKDEINRKNVCSWIETNMLNEKFEGYKLRIVRDKNNEIKKDDEENKYII
ncbi:Chaperone protein HtpG, partial [Dictyocoela roeselum]